MLHALFCEVYSSWALDDGSQIALTDLFKLSRRASASMMAQRGLCTTSHAVLACIWANKCAYGLTYTLLHLTYNFCEGNDHLLLSLVGMFGNQPSTAVASMLQSCCEHHKGKDQVQSVY